MVIRPAVARQGARGCRWREGAVGATPRDIEFGAASESQLLSAAARSPPNGRPCQVLRTLSLKPGLAVYSNYQNWCFKTISFFCLSS